MTFFDGVEYGDWQCWQCCKKLPKMPILSFLLEVLGRPIVNEDEGTFEIIAQDLELLNILIIGRRHNPLLHPV